MRCLSGSRRSTAPAGARSSRARSLEGYSLLSARTGVPIARLRPTGKGDKVQVLWWNGERWAASGPFGVVTMPLDDALDYVAHEPAFWLHA